MLMLQMHKTTLSEWLNVMRDQNTLADELAIFALSWLYRCHSVVYTKTKTWSTIGNSTPMSEKDVYMQCDLKCVHMGWGNFVQLIKKLTSCMPVLPLKAIESVYESGYFKSIHPNPYLDTAASTSTPKIDNEVYNES